MQPSEIGLLFEHIPTILPRIYHTYDHQKNPERFLGLHKRFVDFTSDDTLLAISCREIAIAALGANIMPNDLVKFAEMYSELAQKSTKRKLTPTTIISRQLITMNGQIKNV